MAEINFPNVDTYKKDGRMPITEIYRKLSRLKDSRWIDEVVYCQKIDNMKGNRKKSLPILAFRTRLKGDALWILSGVHGEEPAGVNAIAKNIRYLNKLAKKIPMVLIPLANPSGYRRNWRYPTLKRRPRDKDFLVPSVGASEHYIINKKTGKAKQKNPINREAEELSSYVLKNAKNYKPLLVLDFHEDESARKQYIYSQGKLKNYDPIARKVVKMLKKKGFKFYEKGKTSFNQKIIKGIVSDEEDGSIDELLAAERIIVNGVIKRGPDAKSVVVIETKTVDVPLKKRVQAHAYILKSAKNVYALAKDIFDEGEDK